MDAFTHYSDVLLDGFINNDKSSDVIVRKYDILQDALQHHAIVNPEILFVGFNPWCLAMGSRHFQITQASDTVLQYLRSKNCNFDYYDLESDKPKKVDVVVAADEYFTFADSDQGQRSLVDRLAEVTNEMILTTLRDYKNQDFKDREFSQPIVIRGQGQQKIYLEHYDYDPRDKNASKSRLYVISDHATDIHGPFNRRNMYFKQLAKFSLDAGAKNFLVHKNLMYKSVIKKNYEHVITIKF